MDLQAVVLDVHFEEGLRESLSLTSLGSGRYRAEESSIASESINLGDVIEAEPIPGNGIRFLRVIEKSSLMTLRWLIPQDAAESEGLANFLQGLMRWVGVGNVRWEVYCSCIYLKHLSSMLTVSSSTIQVAVDRTWSQVDNN